jgi:hypothetical protein
VYPVRVRMVRVKWFKMFETEVNETLEELIKDGKQIIDIDYRIDTDNHNCAMIKYR